MSAQQDGFESSGSGSTTTKERVAEAASTTMSTATDATKNVVGEATGQTKAVAGEAKAQAQQLISDARSEFQTQADDRARQAVDQLRGMSTSITALLNGRPEEAAQMTGYLQQAQNKIEGIASRIEAGGPQGVIDDLSSFARRRPGAFLFAAGVAGFAIGRVARAGAAAARDEQGSATQQQPMLQAGGR
jgi:uncharacterized phage infection (PIP) family protein YhgE